MSNQQRPRLLLADSNVDYRHSIHGFLKLEGYRVEEAATFEEARVKLGYHIDLLLVEVRMRDDTDPHDISGLELAKIASELGIPCIIVTAFPTIDLARIALRSGGTNLIAKTDGPQAILDSIRHALKSRSNVPTSGPPPKERGHLPRAEPREETIDQSESAPPSGERRDIPKMASREEEVHFTAVYPKEGTVDVWHTLLVYAHVEAALKKVRADAKRFSDEIPLPKETSAPAQSRLKRGTEITIVPACEGVTFNPERASVKWLEDYHRADFRFRADPSLKDDAAKGQITFYVGPLIVGTLKFAMLFGEAADSSTPSEEEHAGMIHRDKIFISYSHRDTDVALAFKKVLEATGYDVLVDIDDLRSGDEWNPELLRMIDRADIFQLFWSENSKKSKYCKQEWKHALKRARDGFIRPVFWNEPIPKPPRELSKYHFELVKL